MQVVQNIGSWLFGRSARRSAVVVHLPTQPKQPWDQTSLSAISPRFAAEYRQKMLALHPELAGQSSRKFAVVGGRDAAE